MPTLVAVSRVALLCNPTQSWPWCCDAPSTEEWATLLKTAPLEDCPVASTEPASRHIGRIRYLAQHGWSDAIEVDVGCPVLGYGGPKWPVTDGNHRLAAAIVRNDAFISVDVAGQLDHAASLLGVSERALMRHPDADAQETKRTLQDAHAHD
jgi:hypothetical protein